VLFTNTVDLTFTLANIPYASYSLLIYDLNSTTGRVQGITLGGTTYYSSSPVFNGAGYLDNNAGTPFTYTQATSTNIGTPTPVSDYVLFTNLTGGTQTVTISTTTGNRTVSGFQIVATPEPGSALLLGTGALALLGFRRRR
jgi:hypothetical protein